MGGKFSILAVSLFWGCVAINLLEEEEEELVYTCNGIEYTPPYQICENGILRIKCGNDYYNPIEQFCSEQNNLIYNKCGGKSYNTETQICKNARIYDKCGDLMIDANIEGCCDNTAFTLATQFCIYSNDSIYDKCDGKLYNPFLQICKDNILKMRCGDDGYDSETQFCSENDSIYDKCDGKLYNPSYQKCEDSALLLECGEQWYDPSAAYCAGNIVKVKGTFVDDRDGRVYKYVIIGEQTWMAENLRYETLNTKYYNNDFGMFYNWNAANAACPLGWHLPTDAEWNVLIDFAGANGGYAVRKLKAKSGFWLSSNGTDDYGFTALPAGYYSSGAHVLEIAGFWSATAGSVDGLAHFYYLFGYSVELDERNIDESLVNVRCIKD
jgi:uncharacterized protein (TIGR02145 family)